MDLQPDVIANMKIAGAALGGGMVRMFIRPAKSMLQAVMLLASCVTCGFYATPPVMGWWGMPADYAGGVGALCGLLGLSIAEGLVKAVDGFNFKALLSAMINKGPA